MQFQTPAKEDDLRCLICNKSFATKQTAQRHMVIHTGEKAFKCHICNKRFNQKSNLRVHMASSLHRNVAEFYTAPADPSINSNMQY